MATIFDEKTLRKLDRLTLVATQVRAGMMKGERRSTKRGSSVEFADYRNYVQGDDLRRVDWNVFARLEKPFIKLLEEEEDLAVHVLVDASRSMHWPNGTLGEEQAEIIAHHKFTYALRLAAALSYVALAAGDRLTVSVLQANLRGGPEYGPARGRGHTLRLLNFLSQLEADQITDLNTSLKTYAQRRRRAGLAIVISDLLSPNGYFDGITALQSRGYELVVLQVLSPDELDPPLAGDLRLLDVETEEAQDVSVDGGLLNLYRQRVQAWQAEQAAWCRRRGVHFLATTTANPWETFVLGQLRAERVLK